MKSTIYRTITGRPLKLGGLSRAEREFLRAVEKKYRAEPEWTEFSSWWLKHLTKAKLPTESVVRRICQDLEARLGIAQGKVAHPDYRNYLADLIEEHYGSRYKFCVTTGIDAGQLSRVFAGRADLSLPTLQRILQALGAILIIREEDTLMEDLSPDQARHTLMIATA